jgi:hypothetical protein
MQDVAPQPLHHAMEPNRDDRALAGSIHREFKAKTGSDHIASEDALAHVLACVREYRPAIAVECGAGIGTITSALLQGGTQWVIAYEHDNFCRSALLQLDNKRVTVVNGDICSGAQADLIVIDGKCGLDVAHRYAKTRNGGLRGGKPGQGTGTVCSGADGQRLSRRV